MIEKLPNKLLPFMWHFLKKYKFTFFAYILCYIVLMDLPALIIKPYFIKLFIDKISNSSMTMLNCLLLLLGIAFSNITYLVNIFESIFSLKSIKKAIEDIRCEMFKYLSRQTTNYFNTNYTGEIVNKINSITDSVKSGIECFVRILKNAILMTILIVILFCFNVKMGFIGIIWFILYIVVSYRYIILKKSTQTRIIQKYDNKISGFINDDFMNIKNIKIFSNEKIERKKILKLLKEKIKNIYLQAKYNQIANSFYFVLNSFLLISFFAIGLQQLKNNSITIGDFTMLIFMFKMLIWFSREIVWFGESIKDIVVMNDSLELITNDITIQDKDDAKTLEVSSGKIVFKNINFKY